MEPTPPDGGWGLMIVVAGFVAQFVTLGQIKSYGVLMLELEEIFETGATLTSWIGGLAQGLTFGLAPISCVFVNKFGHRPVVITSGILAGTGMSLGYFANSLAVLFITYGIIFGIGVGLLYNPCFSILPMYFQKHLSFSAGVVIAGGGLGALCFPLLLEYLLIEYNYKSTLLICGGIAFNVILSGLLMRPLSKNNQTTKNDTPTVGAKEHYNFPAQLDDCKEGEFTNGATMDYKKSDESLINDGVSNDTSWFQWYLLFDPYYGLFVTSRMMFAFSFFDIYVLLPTKVQELDDNSITEAKFVSLMSLSELTSRLLWGVIWDRKTFRPPVVRQCGLAIMLLLGGVTMFLIGVVESVSLLGVLVVLMGVWLGGSQAPLFLVVRDLIGTKHFGDGLGIMMFAQAIMMVISPLVTGSLVDKLGSVTTSYAVMGIAWLSASCLTASLRLLYCCNVSRLKLLRTPVEPPRESPPTLWHTCIDMSPLNSSQRL